MCHKSNFCHLIGWPCCRRGGKARIEQPLRYKMADQNLTFFIAIWGSIISTILAGTKLWETWRDRRRLTTSYSISYVDDRESQIIIENPSNTPVMITYWELLWIKGRFFRRETFDGAFPNEGYCNITIKAHDRYVLSFQGKQRHNATEGKLHLKLYIAGRNKPCSYIAFDPAKSFPKKKKGGSLASKPRCIGLFKVLLFFKVFRIFRKREQGQPISCALRKNLLPNPRGTAPRLHGKPYAAVSFFRI